MMVASRRNMSLLPLLRVLPLVSYTAGPLPSLGTSAVASILIATAVSVCVVPLAPAIKVPAKTLPNCPLPGSAVVVGVGSGWNSGRVAGWRGGRVGSWKSRRKERARERERERERQRETERDRERQR